MDRRTFLITASLLSASTLLSAPLTRQESNKMFFSENVVQPKDINDLKDYLKKMAEPDKVHQSDIFVNNYDLDIFKEVHSKLLQAQKSYGFGNFMATSMREVFDRVSFSENEKGYMMDLFNQPASKYGFYGDKPIVNFWNEFDNKKLVKLNGLIVLEGEPIIKYKKIVSEISDVYMTSGIRNIPKQMLLFMDKAKNDCKYNLSMASRSLAPAGYSYHGVGDFDIGKKGLHEKNFTEVFAETNVFKEAVARGYIQIRYEKDNLLGVRFEPWHVKV